MTCRIIIADDHPMFREAMRHTVQRLLPEATIEEAGDLDAVLALLPNGSEPDTLILDLRFPGLTCISQLAELRRKLPRTTLIVVSMVDDEALIGEVMAAGIDGFIGKNIAPDEIGKGDSGDSRRRSAGQVCAFRAVAAGDRHRPHPASAGCVAADRPRQDQQGNRSGTGYLAVHRAHPCVVVVAHTQCAVAGSRRGEVFGRQWRNLNEPCAPRLT